MPIVSAQSNFNCSVYPRLSVPGDMVRLMNIWGNDSHAQFGNLSDYDYSVACKSNITTISTGCAGNFINVAQLYSGNDSHVSIDNFYPYSVCFNASSTYAWYYDISAISATPSGYECLFSIAMYNDSHVWECDHPDATYNVNLKINSTLPPYAGCVDLLNESTYQGKVLNNSDAIFILKNVSICQKTYYINDRSSNKAAVFINASDLTFDCNNSMIIGNGSGRGLAAQGDDRLNIYSCTLRNYSTNVRIDQSDDTNISRVTSYEADYCFFDNNNRARYFNITAYNCDYGMHFGGSWHCIINRSYIHDNVYVGMNLAGFSGNNTVANTTIYHNPYGVNLSSDSSGNIFYFNNFTSSSSYHAFSASGSNRFNTTNGSSCGANCSRGNYWDDILTLDILDLNGDGFGESGTQYPYNSSFSSKVNINVTDWGPITSKGCTDADGDGFYAQSASPACPGTYRDCDDNNANILPPKDELIVTADTILCNGTYRINDAAADGLIKSGASNIQVRCNGTIIIGDGTGTAINITKERVTINNCTLHSYWAGIYATNANYTRLTNNTAFNMTQEGFYFGSGHDNNLTRNTAFNMTQNAFRFVASSDNRIFNNTAYFVFNNCFWLAGFAAGSLRNNLTNNTAYSCGYGFTTNSMDTDNFFMNNTASGSTDGFEIGAGNNTFLGNRAYNNSGSGFYQVSGFPRADYSTYIGNRAYNNTRRGFNIRESSYCRFIDNFAADNGPSNGDGFLFEAVTYSNITGNRAERNMQSGMYLKALFGTGSNNNNLTGNTVSNNLVGVLIDATSTGNRFYGNSFVASTAYHAFVQAAGNFFNTTNGSACGSLCARGNYWDDILSIDIYDTNADGFGDAGTQYPYNAANGGNVSTNVQDEGPITTKGPPAVPAAASMVIFGLNGTEVTSTRNVFINITFGTAVLCRWANDAESNLAAAPWENCTTVKPWILSEAEGNKTAYMETKTALGVTTIVNDSIIYSFVQDFTPPTAPVVYDSNLGYDIDWWNENTTLSAYWFNATDDISTIYYKYRILDNGACYGGDCSWTDVGEQTQVTVTGISLTEGRNYSFQVVAYISSALNSSIATSNGTKIDLTPPSAPVINSTTHPAQAVTYGSGNVSLNFTSTDALSGIDGYSYLIDEYPGTAPDDNMEGRYMFTLEEMVNDGHAQLLRGNASVGSPHTYAVFSQLKSNFSIGETVRVRVAMAEQLSDYDDLMGVKVYIISIADGNDVPLFNNEPASITTIANVSRDVRYAEHISTASIYEFELTVSSPFNDNLNDAYVVVTGITTDDDNRNNLSIAYSTTDIDNSTKNYVFDNGGAWSKNTSDLDYAIEVRKQDSGNAWDVQYENLQDGTYYFHAKAKDIAGNWGDTSHYKLMIDTAGVRIDIISPSTGQLFSTENITVTVKVGEQANVTVFAMHPDGSNDTSDSAIVNDTYVFNVTLENSTNRLYAAAINPSNGIVTYSPSVYVSFGPGFVGSRTLRVVYGGAPVCVPPLCVASEAIKVGMATENSAASFGASEITSDTQSYTIKIFATTPDMPQSSVVSDLEDDEFLDRKLPMFGYARDVKEFIIRTEVRYPTAYLAGERTVGPGKYNIVFKNLGTTPEGKANVSVRII